MNDAINQDSSIANRLALTRPVATWFRVAMILLASIYLWGCPAPTPPEQSSAAGPPGTETKTGYAIPLFSTAAEQLNYAKSVFSNPGKKTAALKMVIERFKARPRITGQAQLELAYGHLGSDYRRAGRTDCRKALDAYRAIIQQYVKIPEVCAQAYWYMAWIQTDLLGDQKKGLVLYQQVADRYPDESFTLVSPVPWLTLIFPDTTQQQTVAEPDKTYSWVTYSWAASALLEIVRRDPGGSRGRRAFDRLWQNHPRTLATGYALLALLNSGNPPPEAERRANRYRSVNTRNSELNRDLERALNSR